MPATQHELLLSIYNTVVMASHYPYSFHPLGDQSESSDQPQPGPDTATVQSHQSEKPQSPSNSTGESASHKEEPNPNSDTLDQTPKTRKRFDFTGSWLWEIGGATLSNICIALLIAFLKYVDRTAYASWEYRLSPNAIISIIMTIAKAAMLVPVSACLSQLKWNQYQVQKPLYNMQILDQASRGPLGAFEVLWNVTPNLATVGALLMILSVAIDPFAQQILKFPSRTVFALNETASVQTAQEHYPKWESQISSSSLLNMVLGIELDPSMQTAILNGLSQMNNHLEPVCTSGNCKYPDFVSLGFCSQCQDVTDQTAQACTPFPANSSASPTAASPIYSELPGNCTYTTPGGIRIIPDASSTFGYGSFIGSDGSAQPGVKLTRDPWTSVARSYGWGDPRTVAGIHDAIVFFGAAKYSMEVHYTPQRCQR